MIVLVVALYPLYFVLIASISNYKAVGRGEVLLWPVDITFDSYLKVFSRKNILIGYRNTLFYTVAGTAINLTLTLLSGYALSVKFPGRRVVNFFITFTMFFSRGITPLTLSYGIWECSTPFGLCFSPAPFQPTT